MPSPSSSSANPGSSASKSSYLPTKGKMLRVLTATQNTSALVFSVFLGVHMVSPIAAAVGGIQAADRTMLIAREYYLPLEPLLVYAPLAVHLSASASKRVLINLNSKTPFKPTILQMSGYILPWFLLPHILSHRLIPSSPVSPIHNLSPSELGFEFVGWGVNKWPVWSALGYGGLVWFGMIHSSLGMMKIVSWLKGRSTPSISVGAASTSSADGDLELPARPKISKWRKVLLPGIMVSFLALITIGLVRVARETSGVSKVMASRYEAVYASMPLARLWS